MGIKEAEQNRFDVVLTSMSEGVIMVDTNYRITLGNSAAHRMFGAEELVGKDVVEALPLFNGINRLSRENRAITRALTEGKTTVIEINDNFLYQDSAGNRVPIAAVTTPLVVGTKVEGAVIVFRDVTAEKEIEEVQSSFIAIASHQLRTPLTGMRWFSEMLLSGDAGEITEIQKHYIQRVYEGTERMISLVGLLLKLAWAESGRVSTTPRPSDVKILVEETITSIRGVLSSQSHRIILRLDPDPFPSMNIDAPMFKQVLRNLLTNALAYSPKEKQVALTIAKKEDIVEVSVKDEGSGISKKDQPRIFERFFRSEFATSTSPDGWGLDLALAKDIVKAWGGDIRFVSEEGKGSTFSFSIPLSGMEKHKGQALSAI